MSSGSDEGLASVPPAIESPAQPLGRLPFAFGQRFVMALLVGFVWLGPAWWSQKFIVAMFFWDLLVCTAWFWDFSRLPPPKKLILRRTWVTRPALAVTSHVGIEISADSLLPLTLRVVDETPLSLTAEPPEFVTTVPARGLINVSYRILPIQRGSTRLGRVFVRYQSSLRLAERRAVADLHQIIRVLPNVEQARKQTLRLIRSRRAEVENRRYRQTGMGREIDSLREYREGDEFRDVSWTATARKNRLITRVFQMERSQTIWLVLDAGRLSRAKVQEPGNSLRLSKLDHAVNGALSLAQVAMHCGDRVGLLAYGAEIQQLLSPGRTAHHFRGLADALAEVHAETVEPDHARAVRVLLNGQKRRSLIVWITDFAETATVPEVIEYAMQVTPRHLVVFAAMNQPELSALAAATPMSHGEMYRHAAALEICQRRDILLRRLRQRGVLSFEWSPWGLSTLLVNQYLDVKERNLL